MSYNVGDELPPFMIESVSPEAMKQWAVFLADPNPIHLDVEVVKAKGLGDKIERPRSSWLHSFAGRRLESDPDPRFAVRKDGGDFDQFTGATITPRAVVGAVANALRYHAEQAAVLANRQPDCGDKR